MDQTFFDESPFSAFEAPLFMKPVQDVVNYPPQLVADFLGKPMDQSVYLVASVAAILFSFILKEIKNETAKRTFSIVTGMSINFFVFGISALVSFIQNLVTYLMMVMLPPKYQHVAVFVTSATILALA
jgi:hypothetical protein